MSLANVRAQFGEVVARVVDGVTKLDRLEFDSKEAQQAATIRKMFLAMATDWRVLLIKLADRLHNMRTIAVMPEVNQRATAQETLDVYAPLAHRLGVQQVKWQLEDLAFATLQPKRYAEIEQMVASRTPEREQYVAEVCAAAARQARAPRSIAAELSGRPKHLWSIYEKMVVNGKEFDEIFDLVGLRAIDGERARLLGDARHAARAVAPRPGPVQGLHQPAEVQPLPVAAHDGHRAARQAHRGPDPHPRDAPARRVRHRGALGLQGARHALRDGLDAPAHRHRAGVDRRDRLPRGPEARPRAGRGLRLHAEGPRHRPRREQHARSTSPTPCTPRSATTASARRSTAGSCRSTRG